MYRKRFGFTLVELLVVIGIIGVLLALLFPAVQASREKSRRAQCSNNQRQLSFALLRYEEGAKVFPGYANVLKTERPYSITDAAGREYWHDYLDVSWMVPLLPYLDHSDVYKNWRDPARGRDLTIFVREAVCPSDPPASTGPSTTPLGYVVNAGSNLVIDSKLYNGREYGVFMNHALGAAGDPSSMVGSAYIAAHDGCAYTLLLADGAYSGVNRTWMIPAMPRATLGAELGCWWASGLERDSQYLINQSLESNLPRPSSRHPGGVMASFCDGRQQFLSEQIDYLVYQHIMTPHGEGAGQILHSIGRRNDPHWHDKNLKDQFRRGIPPMYCPGKGLMNITNTTFDPATIE